MKNTVFKRTLCAVLSALMVLSVFVGLPLTAGAAVVSSGSCGTGVTYTLDSDGTLTISGSGAMTNYSSKKLSSGTYVTTAPWGGYTVNKLIIGYGVTAIGEYAFYGLTGITDALLPGGLTTVRAYAFFGCTGLKRVALPLSLSRIANYAFYNCAGIQKAYYAGSETQWSTNVSDFGNNGPLTAKLAYNTGFCGGVGNGTNLTWTLGSDGVLSVTGSGAMADYEGYDDIPWYANRSSIKAVVVKSGVTHIGDAAFIFTDCESVSIASSVKSIGGSAFYYCDQLTSLQLPEGVESLGDGAFAYCRALENVSLPSTLKSMGEVVFENSDSIKTIIIPDGITELQTEAFCDCTSLEVVFISASVTKIDNFAFAYCGLKAVFYGGSESEWNALKATIGDGNEELLEADEFYFDIDSAGYCGADADGMNLIWIIDTNGTLTISGTGAMKKYNTVSFGSVTRSGAPWAGENWGNVKKLIINEGVTTISAYAFYNCQHLTSAELPASLTNIGSYAFSLTELETVDFNGDLGQWGAIAVAAGNSELLYAEISLTSNTGSGYCGADADGKNLTWSLDGSGTLTISGTGAMANEGSSYYYPWYPAKNNIKKLVVNSGVTSIGHDAFDEYSELKSAVLPASLETVESYAFSSGGLNTVDYKGTFGQWTAMTIGIGNYPLKTAAITFTSFEGGGYCGADADGKNLTWALDNSGTLTINGTGAMANEGSSYYYPWYPAKSFIKKLVVNSGVTKIEQYAFYNYTELKSAVLPSSLEEVIGYAFDGTGLETVDYKGTLEQWFATKIYSYNYPLTDAAITFTSLEISGYCGADEDGKNLTWALDNSGTLTISGTGAMMFKSDNSYYPWYKIKPYIKKLVVNNGVTSIEYDAFDNSTELKSAVLPASLEKIGNYAFYETGLETVDFKGTLGQWFAMSIGSGNDPLKNAAITFASLEAGGYCGADEDGKNLTWALDNSGTLTISGTGKMVSYSGSSYYPWYKCKPYIKKLVVNSGVTKIEQYAFYNSTELKSAVLPASLETVGYYAFYTTGLETVTFNGTKSQWDAISIGNYNDPLKNATLTCTATEAVGYCGADADRKNLTYKLDSNGTLTISGSGAMMDFPDTTIDGKYRTKAPWGWENVKKLVVGSGVTTIGKQAFEGCENLKSAELPASLTMVKSYAFYGSGLETVDFKGSFGQWLNMTIENNNSPLKNAERTYASIAANGFCGAGEDATTVTWSLAEDGTLTISGTGEMKNFNETIVIGRYLTLAPWGWEFVKKLVIQNGVTSIGECAFEGCVDLKSAELPVSLTTVKDSAFYDSGLETVNYKGTLGQYGAMTIESWNDPLHLAEKTFTANTGSGYCGADEDGKNLTWNLAADGTLTISGTGKMKNYSYASSNGKYATSAPWGSVHVKKLVINSGVTSIGSSAFSGCANLKSAELPASLTSIGRSSFHRSGLETVNYKGTLGQFNTVLIGSSNGPLVEAKKTMTSYEVSGYCGAAADGKNLTFTLDKNGTLTIRGSGKMKDYEYHALYEKKFSDPEVSLEIAKTTAPWGWEYVKKIVINDGVTSVGAYAFAGCDKVAGITMPNSVEAINEGAYEYCTGATSATLSTGLETIGKVAFRGCLGLTAVTLGKSVAEYGVTPFAQCYKLKGINVDADNTYFSSENGVLFNNINKKKTKLIDYPAGKTEAEYAIPDGVTSIENYAVYEPVNLRTLTIPESVTTVGNYALYWSYDYDDDGNVIEENIKTIVYQGTKEAFNEISFGSNNNGKSRSKIVYRKHSGDHVWDNGTVTAATCTAAGKTVYKCTIEGCLETRETEIPAKNHNWGTWTKLNDTQHQHVCKNDSSHVEKANHTWDSGKVTKAATCTANGTKTYTCTVCNATKTESIPAGHTWGSWTKLNATQHQRVCTKDSSHVEKANHTWDNGTVTKPATTAAEGERLYKCTACGATKTEKIAKIPETHTHDYKLKYNASKHWYECSCGATKDTADHKWDNGSVTKAATCAAEGIRTFTCAVCKTTKTEKISATGHKYGGWTKLNDTQHRRVCEYDKNHVETANHTWDSGKVTKAATCKEAGVKTYTCTACKATKTEGIAQTKNHTWDGGKVTKAATTTAEGVRTYTCTVCGETKTEKIDKIASSHVHDYKLKNDADSHWYECSCGAQRENAPHKWDSGKITKAATCKDTGVKTYTCTVCNATKTETVAKTTTHTWDSGKVTKEATATAEGVKTFTCTVCGTTRTEAIPKTSATYTIGDVDGDGQVLAGDARYALRAAVGLDDTKEGLDFSSKTSRCFLAADVTKDGEILSDDARIILRAAVGLSDLNDPKTW